MTKTQKKSHRSSKKFLLKRTLNKKVLIRFGVVTSLTLNLLVLFIIGLALVQSHEGKVTNLTKGYLLGSTCNNYFTKQKIEFGASTKVGGVTFMPVYLNKTQQSNSCNTSLGTSYFTFKTLLEVNNPVASNYFVNTTLLNTGYLASHPQDVTIPIAYDENTKKPINLDLQDVSY
jgi:hypothetical protein